MIFSQTLRKRHDGIYQTNFYIKIWKKDKTKSTFLILVSFKLWTQNKTNYFHLKRGTAKFGIQIF